MSKDSMDQMMQCIVAKSDLKLWNGQEYIMTELGQEVELPKRIARLEAKSGFVRMIGPK